MTVAPGHEKCKRPKQSFIYYTSSTTSLESHRMNDTMPRRRRLLACTALLSLARPPAADAAAPDSHDAAGRPSGGVDVDQGRRRRRHRRRLRPSPPTTTTAESSSSPPARLLRDLSSPCLPSQRPFVLNFQTDSYGSETSWSLHNDDDNVVVGRGPPDGVSYGDFALYSASYCLDVGTTYTLAMEDDFGDGMCCDRGHGGYEYSIDSVVLYASNLLRTFDDYVEHVFTVREKYTIPPTSRPTTTTDGGGGGSWSTCVPDPTTCGCDDVDKSDYRGSLSITISGYECQAWDERSPHDHEYDPDSYPDAGLYGNNHCRNPDGGSGGPWCMTTDADVRWEYCDVPSCPTTGGDEGTTMPTYYGSTAAPMTDGPTISPSESPTYRPTRPPTPKPTPDYSVLNPLNGCNGGDSRVTVEVRADEFSEDTSFDLLRPDGSVLFTRSQGSFDVLEYVIEEACLPHGLYPFVIRDAYGDGMCCRYGEGFFKINVDGREVLNGGSYNSNITATINVGYDPTGWMTERDAMYLEAHNVRRREWHERHNLTYVPLWHSPELARASRAWAEELLHSCEVVGIEHEDNNPYGENLAKNTGDPETWGQLYPPENIVRRWVDFEVGLPYPSNGHLTQALWRASKYVGCGESVREFRGGVCRVQVCRYGRAGNCDMSRFNATEGENWLVPMLANYSRCGPECPEEGCH